MSAWEAAGKLGVIRAQQAPIQWAVVRVIRAGAPKRATRFNVSPHLSAHWLPAERGAPAHYFFPAWNGSSAGWIIDSGGLRKIIIVIENDLAMPPPQEDVGLMRQQLDQRP